MCWWILYMHAVFIFVEGGQPFLTLPWTEICPLFELSIVSMKITMLQLVLFFAGFDAAPCRNSRVLQTSRGICYFPIPKKPSTQNDLSTCKFLRSRRQAVEWNPQVSRAFTSWGFALLSQSISVFFLISLRKFLVNLKYTKKTSRRLLKGRSQLVIEMFQADILAKYKPVINATLLIHNLRQVEETTAKALEYFKSTRHIVLYYEDVVRNRTVRHYSNPEPSSCVWSFFFGTAIF